MSFTQYKPARTRLQRSELAVPGSNPGMFEKAAASNADYIFLDCEDAVIPDDKPQARKNIIQALNEIDWQLPLRVLHHVFLSRQGAQHHRCFRLPEELCEDRTEGVEGLL